MELVRDKAATVARIDESVAPRHQRGSLRFECLAGAHDRPVALVWYRDHVAGSQQARTQRALLPLHVLAIDGRGVLLELWHVAVDCEPATLEARVIWLGLGLGLGLG